MIIRDNYLLCRSDEFQLDSGCEATVNLSLKKAPPLPCTKLYGKVTSGCKPISQATIKILDKNFKPLYHTDTDKEGKFSFIHTLTPGEYQLMATAKNYIVSESHLLSLKPSIPLYVSVKLKPDENAKNGTIYGMVRDEKNAPLPGAQIYISSCVNIDDSEAITISNTDGEYLLYGLKPGKYVIRAFLKGFLFPKNISITLYTNEIECADLYLYREASASKGTISGKVVYDGIPVPYAITALYRVDNKEHKLIQIQKANSYGLYLFSGLKAGTYLVKSKLENKDKIYSTNFVLK